MNRYRSSILFLGLVTSLSALPGLASAGGGKAQQFSVPFSCGSSEGGGGAVPGDYRTRISALNVSDSEAQARIRVALTEPRNGRSEWVRVALRPGAARSIDCEAIRDDLFMFPEQDLMADLVAPRFFEGFLVIQVHGLLEVVAHYTASGQGEVSSQMTSIEGRPARIPKPRKGEEGYEICHIPPGNPSNAHTIEVEDGAVDAHLRHGDHRGECDGDEER